MAPRFNLRHPRLHTPSEPIPEWAFYVNSTHLVVVKPWTDTARRLPDIWPSLYLRKVTNWTPRWS